MMREEPVSRTASMVPSPRQPLGKESHLRGTFCTQPSCIFTATRPSEYWASTVPESTVLDRQPVYVSGYWHRSSCSNSERVLQHIFPKNVDTFVPFGSIGSRPPRADALPLCSQSPSDLPPTVSSERDSCQNPGSESLAQMLGSAAWPRSAAPKDISDRPEWKSRAMKTENCACAMTPASTRASSTLLFLVALLLRVSDSPSTPSKAASVKG
mmetsp:Transcript_90760/g.241158  ORF Transcript_90760/g.241158 Transcript_90760/m.241158 type:complete len:212 (-) Transcript_90760:501-1136(-)